MGFGTRMDAYVAVRLALSDYKASPRRLNESYRFCGHEVRARIREDECRLLSGSFENWAAPFRRSLKGWREDSPMYVLQDGELVAGLYLSGLNEFDDDGRWGQVHYTFVRPDHRGRGLYAELFRRAVERAGEWRLTGLVVNTDRQGLPEMYGRWGAVPWKRIPKDGPFRVSSAQRVIRRLLSIAGCAGGAGAPSPRGGR